MSERRVAFLSEHASPVAVLGGQDAGGQNVYVDELSRHLGNLGHSVDIFTRWESPDDPDAIQWAPNVRVIHVRTGPPHHVLKDDLWRHMPAFRDAILRHIRDDGRSYDLIHANFWMSGWAATEIKRELGIPVVQIFHATGKTKQRHQGSQDTSPADRIAVETRIAHSVDRIIAQCPAEHDELVQEYGVHPSRVALIPSAVNVQRFRPVDRDQARGALGLQFDDLIIGYVGRMLPRKDVRNIVRAVARMPETSTRVNLLLVGGETEDPDPVATPEIGVLRDLATELGIDDRVIFTGKRQPDTLWLYYGAADVMVTTPWYEPFGLTPLEAMACGRPVVGSDVGGINFTVQDGVTGLLVPPGDPSALAARLQTLLGDEGLRARMGAAGRERVEREFTWRRVAAQTARLYDDLLANRDAGNHQQPEVETVTSGTQVGDGQDVGGSRRNSPAGFWR